MQALAGKVAVVTGGGSGIGRGMALAFADSGMHVALADVDLPAAERVRAEVEQRGVRGLALRIDVSSRAEVEVLAEKTFAELGGAHLICNNAGVAIVGPLDAMSDADWHWTLAVNLDGVVHGLQAFLPRLRAQGQGGHIVNTASMAGHFCVAGLAAYHTTKFAVVGLSEALELELTPHGIGVSVLCPGLVRTQIFDAGRNRPTRFGGLRPPDPNAVAMLDQLGIDPERVGREVRDAVVRGDFYIFTHPEMRSLVDARFARIQAAFDAATAREAARVNAPS
jgi:NAD(P)-dependent dehydrogenase (short-subunit alcohol dehydrogenase family)